MSARWILGVVAVVFAALTLVRLVRNRARWDPATKAWAMVALIFALVSLVLWR